MDAINPTGAVGRLPFRWGRVLRETAQAAITDRVSLAAAGCAFYATLALFPAISMIVATYGLVFSLSTVEPQLENLRTLLPPDAFALIAGRVRTLVTQPSGSLTISLLVSTLVALWSSATGTKSILGALNLAYDVRETRSFLRFQGIAFVLTFGGILAASVGIAMLVLLPAVEAFFGLQILQSLTVFVAPLFTAGVVMFALCLVYRYGPSRESPGWRMVLPGAGAAALVWLAASVLFSWYVGHVASYSATYGPLGAVIGLMMWFFVSAFCVLAGAELNAAYERQRGGGAPV